jgi:hypothetical protein
MLLLFLISSYSTRRDHFCILLTTELTNMSLQNISSSCQRVLISWMLAYCLMRHGPLAQFTPFNTFYWLSLWRRFISPMGGLSCYFYNDCFPYSQHITCYPPTIVTLVAGVTIAYYQAGSNNNHFCLQAEKLRDPFKAPLLNILHPKNAQFCNHSNMQQAFYIDNQNKKKTAT